MSAKYKKMSMDQINTALIELKLRDPKTTARNAGGTKPKKLAKILKEGRGVEILEQILSGVKFQPPPVYVRPDKKEKKVVFSLQQKGPGNVGMPNIKPNLKMGDMYKSTNVEEEEEEEEEVFGPGHTLFASIGDISSDSDSSLELDSPTDKPAPEKYKKENVPQDILDKVTDENEYHLIDKWGNLLWDKQTNTPVVYTTDTEEEELLKKTEEEVIVEESSVDTDDDYSWVEKFKNLPDFTDVEAGEPEPDLEENAKSNAKKLAQLVKPTEPLSKFQSVLAGRITTQFGDTESEEEEEEEGNIDWSSKLQPEDEDTSDFGPDEEDEPEPEKPPPAVNYLYSKEFGEIKKEEIMDYEEGIDSGELHPIILFGNLMLLYNEEDGLVITPKGKPIGYITFKGESGYDDKFTDDFLDVFGIKDGLSISYVGSGERKFRKLQDKADDYTNKMREGLVPLDKDFPDMPVDTGITEIFNQLTTTGEYDFKKVPGYKEVLNVSSFKLKQKGPGNVGMPNIKPVLKLGRKWTKSGILRRRSSEQKKQERQALIDAGNHPGWDEETQQITSFDYFDIFTDSDYESDPGDWSD